MCGTKKKIGLMKLDIEYLLHEIEGKKRGEVHFYHYLNTTDLAK